MALKQKILRRLADVADGSTLCAGQLSRDCGSVLREAREDILALAKARKIVLRQRGKKVKPDGLKGPFRASLR